MGGIGSGRRYKIHERRQDVEEHPSVDLRLFKNHLSSEVIIKQSYRRMNRTFLKILIEIDSDEMTVHFPFDGKIHRQKIDLTQKPCNFGGTRSYIRCPECGGKFCVLYLGSAGTWACRHCLGLAYRCQRLNKRRRHLQMVKKIEDEKLNGVPYYKKPPRMRKKTHSELVQKLAEHHIEINRSAHQWYEKMKKNYLS